MKYMEGLPEQDDANSLDPVPCKGNAMVDGYQTCEVEAGTHFSQHEMTERMMKICPMMPEPVEGGFVPLNNVFERL